MSRGGRSTITRLFFAHLVTDIYMPVIPAILPILIMTNGYSYLLAGLLVTSYSLTSSITQPFFGWMADSKGWAVPISASVLISAVFMSIIGLVQGNYAVLLVCAAIAALGHACFHPGALSAVSRVASDENRGKITSIFVVGGNLGYAIGPVITGVLVTAFGLPGLVLMVIPAVLVGWALRTGIPGPRPPAPGSIPPGRWIDPAARISLFMLFSASTLRAWAVFAVLAFFPQFLVMKGFDLVVANLLLTVTLLAGVIGQVTGGILSDRYGRKEFVYAGLVLSVPFLLLFLTSSGILSVVALIVFGFCLWSSFAVTVAMAHEIMPHHIGITSGLMIGVAIGAGGIGVAVSGMIADAYSLPVAIATIPFLILGAAVLIVLLRYPWKSLVRSNG